MKILVLDDDPLRIDAFRELFSGHDTRFFQDSDSMTAFLKGTPEPYDLVFLDHDLGGDVLKNNGLIVARFLAEHTLEIGAILIHSSNPVGAEQMEHVLKKKYRVYRAPDVYLKEVFERTFPGGL